MFKNKSIFQLMPKKKRDKKIKNYHIVILIRYGTIHHCAIMD